jgi:hypothetical protein
VNQKMNGRPQLGGVEYKLDSEQGASEVRISNEGANGYVMADVVVFRTA